MAKPFRQRQVASFIREHPDLVGKPTLMAMGINCSHVEAKLALSKLRKRLGGNINPEQLCSECLVNSVALGVCTKCGFEYRSFGATNVEGDTLESEFNPVDIGYQPRVQVKLSRQTVSYLKGSNKTALHHIV